MRRCALTCTDRVLGRPQVRKAWLSWLEPQRGGDVTLHPPTEPRPTHRRPGLSVSEAPGGGGREGHGRLCAGQQAPGPLAILSLGRDTFPRLAAHSTDGQAELRKATGLSPGHAALTARPSPGRVPPEGPPAGSPAELPLRRPRRRAHRQVSTVAPHAPLLSSLRVECRRLPEALRDPAGPRHLPAVGPSPWP